MAGEGHARGPETEQGSALVILYFCASKARQYLYFCTIKASKLSTCSSLGDGADREEIRIH